MLTNDRTVGVGDDAKAPWQRLFQRTQSKEARGPARRESGLFQGLPSFQDPLRTPRLFSLGVPGFASRVTPRVLRELRKPAETSDFPPALEPAPKNSPYCSGRGRKDVPAGVATQSAPGHCPRGRQLILRALNRTAGLGG